MGSSNTRGALKAVKNMGGVRLSNSFSRLGVMENEEDKAVIRTPTTFLDIFEKALSYRDKGNGKMEAPREFSERGFSPTH